jgi:peptidoglycan/LPS O-acetylase OafA/YrhL
MILLYRINKNFMNRLPASNPESAFHSLAGGRVPGLDGWRAVSILLVLFSHCHWVSGHPNWMDSPQFRSLGAMGVRCFFVISGFLITLLMLREAARSGTVDARSFYLRRALRIFPVYFAFLATLLILQIATKLEISTLDWVASLTFSRNFFGTDWITGHLWSLGIEQQFYLLWPLAFILTKPHAKPMRGIVVLLVPLLVCPLFRVTGGILGGAPYFSILSFFLQADALAVGCLTALTIWHSGPLVTSVLSNNRQWMAPMGLILIVLPLLLPTSNRFWFLIGCVSPQGQAWGFSILLVLAMQESRWPVFKLLDSSMMVFLGAISYSLYIWQQIFCTNPAEFGMDSAWWNSYPCWLLAAFFAAVASHYLVERPFLLLKSGSKLKVVSKELSPNEPSKDFPRS